MLKYGLSLICILLLCSCSGEEKKAVFDGVKLQKSSFTSFKKWNKDFLGDGFDKALKDVCLVLDKKTSQILGDGVIRYSISEYKKHCKNIINITDEKALKQYIFDNFEPYKVVYNGCDEGKFTSYYEADVNVSYTKDEKYKYPIYGKPDDLVEINLHDFDVNLPNQRLLGRVENGKVVKYYTRKEIENNEINAPVILWGDSLVDIHIMQIQGAFISLFSISFLV